MKMQTNKENLENLVQKIDWEGGLFEYLFNYGGEMPDELKDRVNDIQSSLQSLENEFATLLDQFDVEDIF